MKVWRRVACVSRGRSTTATRTTVTTILKFARRRGSPKSQGVNNRCRMKSRRGGGGRKLGNGFGNICGKCEHTRETRAVVCVCSVWRYKAGFRRGRHSVRRTEWGKPGKWIRPSWLLSHHPISPSHMRLSFLRRIPRLRITKQRHWISFPSSSAALFSSFSPSSSFSSFTSPILWHVPPADSSRSAILMARSKSKARSGYLTVNLL